MNANFEDRVDALVTLSFAGDIPEDSAGMKRMMHNFIQRLRRRYQKAGKRLKYIYCMEIGPRGSRHVHMMLSQADLQELVDAWGYGPVNVQPLWSKGQYADIAAYFIKYALKTAETEGGGKKIGQLYTPSRGLCRPKVTKTIVHARTFRESIRDRRGWRLDKNSIRRGVHEAMGTPYLEYTFVRD
ncbi:MAG: hypothetical protein Q4C60_09580 [Eubacteriales bacterium]|nr:hypothetical protein [Eubacteriales bacterium]